MNQSPITLQCPHCRDRFITLKQGSGPLETCPHCAHAAPRVQFQPIVANPESTRPQHLIKLPDSHPPPATPTSPPAVTNHAAAAPSTSFPIPHGSPILPPPEDPLDNTSEEYSLPLEEAVPPISINALLITCIIAIVLGAIWMLRPSTQTSPTPTPEIDLQTLSSAAKIQSIIALPSNEPETIQDPWIPSLPTTDLTSKNDPTPDRDLAEEPAPWMMISTIEAARQLNRANTLDQRLPLFRQADKHRDGIESFFQNSPVFREDLLPESTLIHLLPSGQKSHLLSLPSVGSSHPTLILLHRDTDSKPTIDWPLFLQSHELHYEAFLAESGSNARWFRLICKLTHDFELPPQLQNLYLTLRSHGSARPESFSLLVARDTPAGRYIGSQMVWDQQYLVDVFVKIDSIGNKRRPFIMEIKTR
ncbi:hypothetical protein FEM03_19835 [Phragmitibacter flavus]|uniref:Uncharacterized protein n=1 Tax=Phragmitibacter flavus TaxID=2576071 RepID=A0A5R8KAH0_9BACT|nr:hypothetical protein [Phragmitibacter flavus]TLD68915.1 hypothetical protein FEM03_19835 [Phragmitibacter flavus]